VNPLARTAHGSVAIHIDEVGVSGIAIADGEYFATELAAELTRLLTDHRLDSLPSSADPAPVTVTLEREMAATTTTDRELARRIAAGVHRSLGGRQ
jgi:hypothetical protein